MDETERLLHYILCWTKRFAFIDDTIKPISCNFQFSYCRLKSIRSDEGSAQLTNLYPYHQHAFRTLLNLTGTPTTSLPRRYRNTLAYNKVSAVNVLAQRDLPEMSGFYNTGDKPRGRFSSKGHRRRRRGFPAKVAADKRTGKETD